MNVWAVIAMIAVVALLYVVIPVVLATRRHFSTYKLVRCPVLGVGAGVLMSPRRPRCSPRLARIEARVRLHVLAATQGVCTELPSRSG